jgi:biotin transport system substrate-specific component
MNTTLASVMVTRFWPRLDSRVRDALLVLTGSLVVAAMAQVRIPLPFTPVPLTGQTFAVLLVGAALGSRRGAGSLLLYLLAGLAGLPFFAGGASGLAYLSGSTGGYLIGFVLAAYVVGRLAETGKDRHFPAAILTFLIGEVLIYVPALIWLSAWIGPQNALAAGLLPFLIGDAIKLVAAALALPAAWKLVE